MITLNELLINGVDYTDYAVWTLQGQNTLDESLDVLYIELKGTNEDSPFRPFDDVRLSLKNGNNTITKKFLIESDTVTKIISNNTYNHNLLFIEETKWFERLFVEKTIRQPLIHNYSLVNTGVFVSLHRKPTNSQYASYEGTASDTLNIFQTTMTVGQEYTIYNPVYLMKQMQDQLNLDVGASTLNSSFTATLNILDNNRNVVYTITTTRPSNDYVPEDTFTFTPNTQGSYTFAFSAHGSPYTTYGNMSMDSDASFDVGAIINSPAKDDYTIRDTVNFLLDTCVTLRETEQPLFQLAEPNDYNENSDYKAQIQKILDAKSPEFTFNKMSLFEALKTIGDYAHFIPRLKEGKVYFDLLGRMDKANIEQLGESCSDVSSLSSNNFCNALDSKVNNLTNIDDVYQGSVSTPDGRAMKTLRTESGNVQITEQNIIIPTEDNIEKIIKLEIGFLKDDTEVGDITPYVYEESEYNALSSYSSAYPNAKMFAIKYKQGSKNITGLSFQRQNVINQAFESIAIKNIIFKKLNKTISWWNNLWDADDTFEIQYRLVYIPSTDAKVTQYKADKNDISNKPLYIAYNQSASKVSSDAYGENLKGMIAKISNVEKTKMYILPSLDLIPKCGLLYDDDYYISVVKYEVYPNFVKCELGLSKNYNNKSAYVEINSQLEFFEYDRNIIIDRYIVYEEFCEVGDFTDDELNASSTSLITSNGLTFIADPFACSDENQSCDPEVVDSVVAQGYDADNNPLTEVVLPVISLGVGNSLLFTYHYEDSVSAGNIAFYSYNASMNAKTRYQNFVKYTDIYGEVDKLKLAFGKSSSNNTKHNYNDAVALGDTLPLTTHYNTSYNNRFFITPDNDKIVLKKGVGEIPHFTYQIHFVSNNPNLVIGSGITRKSVFTTGQPTKYRLYALTKPINKFETKIDLTDAVWCGKMNVIYGNQTNKQFKLDYFRVPQQGTYKAWAIVDVNNNNNDLIIGENIDFEGEPVKYMKLPSFKFKRRIK